MAIYALWNNKGGVGKSYLTFQIACEYARTHPEQRVLVLDVCPQANATVTLLGGMFPGETALSELTSTSPHRTTIAGYVRERITRPYDNPSVGSKFLLRVCDKNPAVPANVFLVPGDDELEMLGSRVVNATRPGPDDAWSKVHRWLSDLIQDVRRTWNGTKSTVFIDCNPSFGIYTELAMSAADRLIIPFSADGSSRRAVRTVVSLLYGITRTPGSERSEFSIRSEEFRMTVPGIYCYVGNRLTQGNRMSAKAFRTVVNEIGDEIWAAWKANPGHFVVHPSGTSSPINRATFTKMFQYEVRDANTASVVSGTLGIPLSTLKAGPHQIAGKTTSINQSQLDRLQPNIQEFVASIE